MKLDRKISVTTVMKTKEEEEEAAAELDDRPLPEIVSDTNHQRT